MLIMFVSLLLICFSSCDASSYDSFVVVCLCGLIRVLFLIIVLLLIFIIFIMFFY